MLANCVWICTAVSNCINLRSHIRQGPFRRHPSASCIVGNALREMEPITLESREGAHHLLVTHSIQQHPTSPTPTQLLLFPLHFFSHFLNSVFFHLPSWFLSTKHSFSVWCHKPFRLFSCVVAVNNGKMRVLPCRKFTQAFVLVLLPHHNSAGNGSLLPSAEARICTSASVVTLPEHSGTAR